MDRLENIEHLQHSYQAMACTSDPLEMRVLLEVHYLHTIIEAMLTENIDSLPTAVGK